ncbi:MAG TPA: efflux RND transporter periplasmic adaptor subunit [Dongiaceae bacterium]|nr:efflux RND transporter periplasmic adaptor subunit [Dongiaceae bacterium]
MTSGFVRALAALLAIAAGLSAIAGCSRAGSIAAGPAAVPVTIAVAETRDVPVDLKIIGTVEAYSTVEVRAQVGGVLEKVHFREGEDVRPGDLLFSLDARPYQSALKSAQAALARDRVQSETAERDLERYGDLVKKEYVTQEEYDRIRTNAASLAASVSADEAAVETARVSLDYCSIRSAIEGRTGQLNVHAGNLVKENGDTPLVVINQVRPIYVAFSVPEENLGAIRAGQAQESLAVLARSSGATGDPLAGKLTFIDNAVDRATGTLRLKATFPNVDRGLWPGEFVEVGLRMETRRGAVLVPTRAVQTGQQGAFVFVVGADDTVAARAVVTGPLLDASTVIEKGVAAGDRVVTDGQLRLVEGTKVAVKP